jgi:hypothetical protein
VRAWEEEDDDGRALGKKSQRRGEDAERDSKERKDSLLDGVFSGVFPNLPGFT